MTDELKNPILDDFDEIDNDEVSLELFEGESRNVDLKTDLTLKEIVLFNKLKFNNQFLESVGLEQVFKPVVDVMLRLKVSQDRKSRLEFVDVNRRENFRSGLQDISSFKNILEGKS